MAKYSNTLSPTKIQPEYHEALGHLAEKQETSISSLVRVAIRHYLDSQDCLCK